MTYDMQADVGTDVSIGASPDGGKTWTWRPISKVRLDDRPWVDVAPDGTAHVIWNNAAGVHHAVSHDRGRTWAELGLVHEGGASSHLAVGPRGEVAVHVVPASGDRFDPTVDLIAVSTDGGVQHQKVKRQGFTFWRLRRAPRP